MFYSTSIPHMKYLGLHIRYTCTSYEVHMYFKWCIQIYPKWQNVNISATKGKLEKNLSVPACPQLKRILAKISARLEGERGPHMRYTCTQYEVYMYLIWGKSGLPILFIPILWNYFKFNNLTSCRNPLLDYKWMYKFWNHTNWILWISLSKCHVNGSECQ